VDAWNSWLSRIRTVSEGKLEYDCVSLGDVIAVNISVRWHQRTYYEGIADSAPRRCRRPRLKVSVVSHSPSRDMLPGTSECTGRSWTLHSSLSPRAMIRSCAREIRCAGGARIHDSRSLTPADAESGKTGVPLHCRVHNASAAHIAKSFLGESVTAQAARQSVVRPKRRGGDDVQCCPEASRRRVWTDRCVQIMLLGSIVRCWSETGMNSCPDPMVRRRQPYSSALLVMQAESQDNVWYKSRSLDLLDRALLCSLSSCTMSGRLSIGILIQIGNFGHCVFRAVFLDCGVVSISLHYGCMSTATPGDPIAIVASQIPALPPYLETQSGRNTGHNLHVSQTCVCKLDLFDVDTRRNETTARDGSKPR
jgi:hypothetical protein